MAAVIILLEKPSHQARFFSGGLVGLALKVHLTQARGKLSMGENEEEENKRLCRPRAEVALLSLSTLGPSLSLS
jgi:hypothetical protein